MDQSFPELAGSAHGSREADGGPQLVRRARVRQERQQRPQQGHERLLGPELSDEGFIYDAAQNYIAAHTPLIVLAGKDYGMGSSRDWAAKGTFLLGIKAVIAESYERIHRSNLVGMGVLHGSAETIVECLAGTEDNLQASAPNGAASMNTAASDAAMGFCFGHAFAPGLDFVLALELAFYDVRFGSYR